ncbi:MAG: haloacid dehalogenase type II [Pseudomonadota bacterium]
MEPEAMGLEKVKALIFDTFGTVVDWRSSVIAEGEALGRAKGIERDWAAFADAWRAGYRPAIEAIRAREAPWANAEQIHRVRLEEILAEFDITGLTEAERANLNRAWHRLAPWPDSVPGLTRLKRKFILASFSNGTLGGLVKLAKHAGLPWDCILSADLLGHYKPDPETYLGAAAYLDLAPEEIMLVAAHNYDHRAAAVHGLRTAFVLRAREYGPDQTSDLGAEGAWDIVTDSFTDLAERLGA